MKNIILLLFTLCILVACDSQALSLVEMKTIPKDIQQKINTNNSLEMINTKNTSYIVFNSKGIVTAEVEIQGDKLLIKFDVTDSEDEGIIQHVYKLTYDTDQVEYIDILINGKSTPIDNVIIGSI